MAKKVVEKIKLVEDKKVDKKPLNQDPLIAIALIIKGQDLEIQKLNARLDRIVAALSTAKRITKDM